MHFDWMADGSRCVCECLRALPIYDRFNLTLIGQSVSFDFVTVCECDCALSATYGSFISLCNFPVVRARIA